MIGKLILTAVIIGSGAFMLLSDNSKKAPPPMITAVKISLPIMNYAF